MKVQQVLIRSMPAGPPQPARTLPESPEQIEHTGVLSALAFSPDGQILATASLDHSVRLWDFGKRKRIAVPRQAQAAGGFVGVVLSRCGGFYRCREGDLRCVCG